jgi:hypothetical protein
VPLLKYSIARRSPVCVCVNRSARMPAVLANRRLRCRENGEGAEHCAEKRATGTAEHGISGLWRRADDVSNDGITDEGQHLDGRCLEGERPPSGPRRPADRLRRSRVRRDLGPVDPGSRHAIRTRSRGRCAAFSGSYRIGRYRGTHMARRTSDSTSLVNAVRAWPSANARRTTAHATE